MAQSLLRVRPVPAYVFSATVYPARSALCILSLQCALSGRRKNLRLRAALEVHMLNRYPLIVAAMLQMDCSGGNVYTDGRVVDTALHMAAEKLGTQTLAAAEQHLAIYTGEQLGQIAMGGWINDEGPKPDETTERVLEYLYEIA
jgi:hypothetical protein